MDAPQNIQLTNTVILFRHIKSITHLLNGYEDLLSQTKHGAFHSKDYIIPKDEFHISINAKRKMLKMCYFVKHENQQYKINIEGYESELSNSSNILTLLTQDNKCLELHWSQFDPTKKSSTCFTMIGNQGIKGWKKAKTVNPQKKYQEYLDLMSNEEKKFNQYESAFKIELRTADIAAMNLYKLMADLSAYNACLFGTPHIGYSNDLEFAVYYAKEKEIPSCLQHTYNALQLTKKIQNPLLAVMPDLLIKLGQEEIQKYFNAINQVKTEVAKLQTLARQ